MSEAWTKSAGHKPWGPAIATFFTCLALGPPIGGIVFSLSVTLASGVPDAPDAGLAGRVGAGLFVGLFALPFSYLIGGVQAAATGFLLAAYGYLRGRPPLWFAGLAALLVYGGAHLSGIADGDGDMAAIFFFVHVIPALLCWLIVRTYWWKADA